jgi:hypothetical protein
MPRGCNSPIVTAAAGFRQTWSMGGIGREGYSSSKIRRDWEHFRGIAVSKTLEHAGMCTFSLIRTRALDGMKPQLIFKMPEVLVLR